MFIGHTAALLSKRYAPHTSLGTLVAAASFIDILWPVLLITGLERVRIEPGNTAFTPLNFEHYPISHSLLTTILWGVVFGAVYLWRKRYRTAAITLGVLVVSHWLLDAIVHRPDLPVVPGAGPMFGLGLWNSVPGTIVVEGLLFAGGVWAYTRATRARDRIGGFGFWSLMAVLLFVYAGNVAGPPPPSVEAIEIAGLAGAALMIVWAAWADRHRVIAQRREGSEISLHR